MILGVLAVPQAAEAKRKKKPAAEEPAPATRTPLEPEPVYGPQWPPPPPPPPEPSENEVVKRHHEYRFTRGRILVGAKAGGAFAEPFGNLGASFLVGVELGWALPRLPAIGRGVTVVLDMAYTQPGASGDQMDPRILANGGAYRWDLTERALSLGLEVVYRAPFVMGGKLVPYLGFGPRLFFLQSATGGEAGSGNALASYREQGTSFGLGVPLGADYAIGPGRVFLEAMLLYAPFKHDVTGDSNVGMITLQAGYRFLL